MLNSFCLKEIGWALELKKPVIVVVERETRFFPFDIERWRYDRCTRDDAGRWVEGWLARKYEECPVEIKTLVEEHAAAGMMIPYRRRCVRVCVSLCVHARVRVCACARASARECCRAELRL